MLKWKQFDRSNSEEIVGQRFKPAAYKSMQGGLNVLLPEHKNALDSTAMDKGLRPGHRLRNNGICGLHNICI
jgi:hypothetical protein